MLLMHDVGTLEHLKHTWVALTIDMRRRAFVHPMTSEYVFPALVAVLAAMTFKTVFASFPIKPSTETINCVK
jgi:hypothetical protein